jgi:prepilin-type N-terminal cleavage/methylation domain-containing protein
MNLPSKRQSDQTGFTIIEVLIVLAIAGLILLIVFMAIPALQRNSRNNQRKHDVQTVLEAVSRYELNNSGTVPDSDTLQSGLQAYSHKLTAYDPTKIEVTVTDLGSSLTSMPANSDLDTMKIYNHAKCDTNNRGVATNSGAGYNDVVALYAIESGAGDTAGQCQEL